MDFLFLYFDSVFFLTKEIRNNKTENVKKFINEKLYGANPKIVKTPNKKGAKNTTTNLLLIIKVTFQIFIFNWLNLKKNFRFFSF